MYGALTCAALRFAWPRPVGCVFHCLGQTRPCGGLAVDLATAASLSAQRKGRGPFRSALKQEIRHMFLVFIAARSWFLI